MADGLGDFRLGLIGAGKMATALARGWIGAGLLRPDQIMAFDPMEPALKQLSSSTGISAAANNRELTSGASALLVATKPAAVRSVLSEIAPSLSSNQLIISIAAGVGIDRMQEVLPERTPVIRVMPNTPCLVGAGASAFSRGAFATSAHAQNVASLMGAVGIALEVPERLLDGVTGLSGSGPAYVFLFIEAMADGGVRAGLDRATALRLAAQTVMGAAKMVLDSTEHPALLKDQVASPAGTTIAGLGVLEARAVRGAVMDAVGAAAERSAELGRE